MLFRKYTDFIGKSKPVITEMTKELVTENVAAAKKFLKDKYYKDKKLDFKEHKLTDAEIRKIEGDPNYIKIRDMLQKDNALGYTYVFVKFFFDEGVPMEELVTLWEQIKENRDIANRLPKAIDKFDGTTDENGVTWNYEKLIDELEILGRYRITKHLVDQFPSDLKKEYNNTTAVVIKDKIANIAIGFEELGEELQSMFIKKIRRYKTLREFIGAAEQFIKGSSNSGLIKFLDSCDDVNDRLGELNGVEVVYNENNIVIIELRSFEACRTLCNSTSWCIANSNYNWDSYVGGDSVYTKQYAIFNFNLGPTDVNSIIGTTIESNNTPRTTHNKRDSFVDTSQLKSLLKGWKVPYEVLKGMTAAEVDLKKRRIVANREIIKTGLTIERAKKFIDDGADPNAHQGKPLKQAVEKDDIEVVKYLISRGANPNIGKSIDSAKNLDMIKILVAAGSQISDEIFKNIMNDEDAVKFVLDHGADPNHNNGFPIRTAARSGKTNIIKILVKYGADVNARRGMAIKWAAEYSTPETVKTLLELGANVALEDALHFIELSDKIEGSERKEIAELLKSKLKK
jgi:hypothetical protein